MSYHKYDEEENALILQVGDNYPQNLAEGFRELSVKLDIEPNKIRSHYYKLKKKEAKRQNYSFLLASKKVVVPDRKIVRKGCPIKIKKNKSTLWKKFLNLLGL